MNCSKEESLLSELKQINDRLGAVMAEMSGDSADPGDKISEIQTDLDELRGRIDDHAR